MQDNEIVLPQNIYLDHLTIIKGINFTRREIDILSCLVSMRGTSKIAFLLHIAPRTVITHIHNIMLKLECNSRDGIIDFIQRSHKLSFLREYYASLIIELAFEKSLKEIAKIKRAEETSYLVVQWQVQKLKEALLRHLQDHLSQAGFRSDVREHKRAHIVQDEEKKHVLLFLPEKEDYQKLPQELTRFDFVDLNNQNTYYFSVFEILKKFLPHSNLEKIIADFKEQYEGIKASNTFGKDPREEAPEKNINIHKVIEVLKNRKWIFMLVFFLVSGLGSVWLLVIKEKQSSTQPEKQKEHSIRSDLIIPTEAIFLSRPELIAQIENKFKGKDGIQIVALVGAGGSGKTTLAHQYASQQKTPIIWEINAETQESLKSSFENLAQKLSITEDDKKELRNLHEIRDPTEREEKIICFVKTHLKLSPSWVLIYDSLEEFIGIQKYFPQDQGTWGQGKVILTTRNNNIQHNKHVNEIISIGELNKNQTMDLFSKIMCQGNTNHFSSFQDTETRKFLENLPPFPLDITLAAYYLKTTNVSYEKYLEHLNQHSKDFQKIQENLLKEAGDYNKTRYIIITLSLQKLMETHKDFRDLLLFISFLNAKNIPREFLDNYKNEIVVDDFIYNLKKYSLITQQSPFSPLGPIFSIHQNIQETNLLYLIKKLDMKNNNTEIEKIFNNFKKYISNTIQEENILKMNLLASHGEAFLNHQDLLTREMRGTIEGELGCLHFYLGNYTLSKKLMEKSIENLRNSDSKNQANVARIGAFLALVYKELGHYEKAQDLLERSLLIYKDSLFENHVGAVWVLVHLGNIYRERGYYEKAKNLIESALTTYSTHLSEDPIQYAWVLVHLGNAYRELGYYEKAKNLFEESLKIHKAKFSEETLKTSWVLAHLGSVYGDLANYEKAKIILEESLKTYRNHFGKNHLKIAWVSSLLGIIYKSLGDYERANTLIEEALAIYEKSYGKEHSQTAKALMDAGYIYLLKGEIETAENLMSRSLKIFQMNNHPDKYMALEALAELLLKKSINEKSLHFKVQAINYLEEALENAKISFSKQSPHIMRIQDKLNKLK